MKTRLTSHTKSHLKFHFLGVMFFLAFFVGDARAEEPSAPSWIDLGSAQSALNELGAICKKDKGRLWGATLCGPVMLVDPASRVLVSNWRSDAQANGKSGLFASTLPTSENIANTAVEWAGLLWTQLSLPLPTEVDHRRVLLVHESFHRLQGEQKWQFGDERGINGHLDTLEGRYLLQLEWRALESALGSVGDTRRRAVADALLFRSLRMAKFPNAETQERQLEWHEGLAEYTGVKLAIPPVRQSAHAKAGLTRGSKQPSFVRSFAYASGPAYGLLLDQTGVRWRNEAKGGADLGGLLKSALKLSEDRRSNADLAVVAHKYDGERLLASETERDNAARKRVAELRTKLLNGNVLRLKLTKPRLQFNPANMVSLGEAGTVYPRARVVDEWGVLSVENNMLLDSGWKEAVVAPPSTVNPKRVEGDGWTLDLNPGWVVEPADEKGSFRISYKLPEKNSLPKKQD